MSFAINFINIFFEVLIYMIFARVLLSLFRTNTNNWLTQFISSVTDPILNIAKKITPKTGMIDFSPLIALIGLELIEYLLITLLLSLQ
jgi:YggT family protein